MTMLILFVYAYSRNKNAKFYLPSTFQTSDIEVLGPKIETLLHLTESLKRNDIETFCLKMSDEHKC